jgi:RNA polymerase sigma-70 factor (ECF subfamily)
MSTTHEILSIDINSCVLLYTKDLYAWAYYKTGDKSLSEDLVQDTFLAAIKSQKNFKGDSEIKTWLFAILKNKIADSFRKATNKIPSHNIFFDGNSWSEKEIPATWNTLEDKELLDDITFKNTLSNCIDKLPSVWSSVIRMKFVDDRKTEIICDENGISQNNYWQIIHRSKLQLRKCLEQNWFNK